MGSQPVLVDVWFPAAIICINRPAAFWAGRQQGWSGHIQIANTSVIVIVWGGPTPDNPSVALSVPANPDKASSFLNIRVADIQESYQLWKSRGATFITGPKEKDGEIPDGYIIEDGQTTDIMQG